MTRSPPEKYWSANQFVPLAPVKAGPPQLILMRLVDEPPTVKVTGTVTDGGFAPGALIVTVSEYVPAPSPETFGCNVTTPTPLPDVPVSDSHDSVFAALQFNWPPPLFEMEIDCELGLLPPAGAENQ